MDHQGTREIIVIGAGVIGVTAALALLANGFNVQIFERKGVAAEASGGNAGAFAYSDIEPLATPGLLRRAPKWLFDPLGPLSIPPAYGLRILPWLIQFWRASRPERYANAVKAQAQLMRVSQVAMERLIKSVSGESLIRREGQLQLYEGERQYQASLPAWRLRSDYGIEVKLLKTSDAISEIQPGLNTRFTHAGFTPGWINTIDPAIWTRHLASQFIAAGGIIKSVEVRALRPLDDGVEIFMSTGSVRASQVVVAAGPWSHQLARTLGDSIPLDTERGYNTTFPTMTFDLRTHLTFSDHGFVVTRIGDGLRVGGAVELGGLNLPPNYKRAEILVRKAAEFLPGLETSGGKQWMGFRPSLPDSLPIISRSPRTNFVIYAFGHGHLGLTQSAGTAELVASIASERKTEIPVFPFDAQRF